MSRLNGGDSASLPPTGDVVASGNATNARAQSPASPDPEKADTSPAHIMNLRVLIMLVLVSMGGFIFGYDTGQISGFLEMPDFLRRFSDSSNPKTGGPGVSNVRSGLIVAL
ncbi:hexose transporter hxt5, partial [Cryomyces antarcticus]